MPIDDRKSALTEDELVELARKHKTTVSRINDIVKDLEDWMLNQTLKTADDAQFLRILTRNRENAQYRTAALVWFVQAAMRQGLTLFEAADIFIALVDPSTAD